MYWLLLPPVETLSAVAAMFALTSGSTIMFRFAVYGDPVCPFACDNEVL